MHEWLRGGWRGAEGKQRAPVIGDPAFEGGQLPVRYNITAQGTGRYPGGGDPYTMNYSRSNVLGPIDAVEAVYSGTTYSDGRSLWYVRIQRLGKPPLSLFKEKAFASIDDEAPKVSNVTVTRTDGQPDTGGDPPGVSQPSPAYDNPVLQNPSGFKSPSSTPVQPLVSPSPASTPPVASPLPKSNPYSPPVFQPDFESGENAQSEATPGRKVFVPQLPEKTFNPARPTKPGTGECKGPNVSPCQSAQFDFLEYLSDQLDRMDRPEEDKPESPALRQIDFPYIRCNDGEAEIFSGTFLYDPASFFGLQDVLEEQAILAARGCDNSESVLAVPDSWQQRRNRFIPTLVLVFRVEGTRTYHSYSIPHPRNTSPLEEPPIDAFQKGNFTANAYLSDGSRVVANCISRNESERVIQQFLNQVDPVFIDQDSFIRVSERKGNNVAAGNMKPARAMFYADGNRTLRPTWRVSFTGRL